MLTLLARVARTNVLEQVYIGTTAALMDKSSLFLTHQNDNLFQAVRGMATKAAAAAAPKAAAGDLKLVGRASLRQSSPCDEHGSMHHHANPDGFDGLAANADT